MRVLVCGGRDYSDWTTLKRELDLAVRLSPVSLVIHGGASGADTLAGRWAEQRGFQVCIFPADWRRHGKAAGPIRNAAMLEHGRPDLVVAFPGGSGTADMVRKARAAKVQVREVEYPGACAGLPSLPPV